MRELDIWEFYLVLCLQNIWFIPVKKFTTFGNVMDVLLPRKFKLISKNFERKNTFVVRPITREKASEVSPWRVRGESVSGRFERKCVVFSEYRSKQCQD